MFHLRGRQAFRYSDGLAMLADQLLACARYMWEMSEGVGEEDEDA